MPSKFNSIQFTFKSVRGPAGSTQREIFQAALYKIRHGKDKPGWEIGEIGWINPETQIGKTKDWQFDEFNHTLSESAKYSWGFQNLLVGYLEEEIEALKPAPRKRRKAPVYRGERYARRKAREIERHAREVSEFMRRSAAAKKGWRTRRRNERKRRRR